MTRGEGNGGEGGRGKGGWGECGMGARGGRGSGTGGGEAEEGSEGRRREGRGEKVGMGTGQGGAVRGRMGAGRRGGGGFPMLQSDSPLPLSPPPPPPYRPVDPSLPNSSAWPLGRWLKVGPDTFSVQYNPPVVDKVTLVKRALAGHEILATPQVWTGV